MVTLDLSPHNMQQNVILSQRLFGIYIIIMRD